MKGTDMIRSFNASGASLRPMFVVTLVALLALEIGAMGAVGGASSGCGAHFFPKCGDPGVNCPPCSGNEEYPDPCAGARRDAGADAKTEAGK